MCEIFIQVPKGLNDKSYMAFTWLYLHYKSSVFSISVSILMLFLQIGQFIKDFKPVDTLSRSTKYTHIIVYVNEYVD